MSSPNKRYQLRLATSEDITFINRVFDSDEFDGKIAVQFTRHPNPYHSLQQEADRTVLILVVDTKENKPCGTGCCQVRKTYLNGKLAVVGYLSSMRIIPEYRGKLINIASVYNFIFEQTPEVDFYYTTILKENHSAIQMLEKPRKHFPSYYKIGEYTVFCLSPNIKIKKNNDYAVVLCQDKQEKDDFLAKYQKNQNLAIVDLLEKDSLWYLLKDKQGRVVGACALANQLDHKQYIIRNYQGFYKILPFLPTVALGYPRVPKIDQPANYSSFHSLCMLPEYVELLPYFLSQIIKTHQEYDFFMIGALEQSPYFPLLSQMRHIKYQSYLYEVKKQTKLNQKDIQLDVSLL